jgi:hypothetical protein
LLPEGPRDGFPQLASLVARGKSLGVCERGERIFPREPIDGLPFELVAGLSADLPRQGQRAAGIRTQGLVDDHAHESRAFGTAVGMTLLDILERRADVGVSKLAKRHCHHLRAQVFVLDALGPRERAKWILLCPHPRDLRRGRDPLRVVGDRERNLQGALRRLGCELRDRLHLEALRVYLRQRVDHGVDAGGFDRQRFEHDQAQGARTARLRIQRIEQIERAGRIQLGRTRGERGKQELALRRRRLSQRVVDGRLESRKARSARKLINLRALRDAGGALE